MRKFLTAVILAFGLLAATGTEAFCQINFVSRYSTCKNADTLKIGRKTFYRLISVTGYDKDTKQLMKNLEVGNVVYLNMVKCSEADKKALDYDISSAVASGKYVSIDSTSVEKGKISMLFYSDNDHVKQVLMYTPAPETSLIQIQCYARLSALSTKKDVVKDE